MCLPKATFAEGITSLLESKINKLINKFAREGAWVLSEDMLKSALVTHLTM